MAAAKKLDSRGSCDGGWVIRHRCGGAGEGASHVPGRHVICEGRVRRERARDAELHRRLTGRQFQVRLLHHVPVEFYEQSDTFSSGCLTVSVFGSREGILGVAADGRAVAKHLHGKRPAELENVRGRSGEADTPKDNGFIRKMGLSLSPARSS